MHPQSDLIRVGILYFSLLGMIAFYYLLELIGPSLIWGYGNDFDMLTPVVLQ